LLNGNKFFFFGIWSCCRELCCSILGTWFCVDIQVVSLLFIDILFDISM